MTKGREGVSSGIWFEGSQVSEARPGAPFDFTLRMLQREAQSYDHSGVKEGPEALCYQGTTLVGPFNNCVMRALAHGTPFRDMKGVFISRGGHVSSGNGDSPLSVIPSVPGFPASLLSPTTTDVVLSKENHMQLTEVTTLDRKSGVVQWRLSAVLFSLIYTNPANGTHPSVNSPPHEASR
jgi:hypothetical protein